MIGKLVGVVDSVRDNVLFWTSEGQDIWCMRLDVHCSNPSPGRTMPQMLWPWPFARRPCRSGTSCSIELSRSALSLKPRDIAHPLRANLERAPGREGDVRHGFPERRRLVQALLPDPRPQAGKRGITMKEASR